MSRTNSLPGILGYANFPIHSPEKFNFAYDVIDRWAAIDRNKLAMIWTNQQGEEKRFTFRDLSQLSNQAANLLIKYGITKGDRVMLMIPRIPQWWIFSLALTKLGAIQCPVPTLLTSEDLRQRIRFGKFCMVITDHENLPKFEPIFDDCPSLNTGIVVDGSH
ncbi:MAG: AMP-binding protein, partial [Victivallaceae bacterium]|nr:AMP-binding protein [Victivallaceae bacterium]